MGKKDGRRGQTVLVVTYERGSLSANPLADCHCFQMFSVTLVLFFLKRPPYRPSSLLQDHFRPVGAGSNGAMSPNRTLTGVESLLFTLKPISKRCRPFHPSIQHGQELPNGKNRLRVFVNLVVIPDARADAIEPILTKQNHPMRRPSRDPLKSDSFGALPGTANAA